MNFTKEQWQLMLAAVIKTRQQYVDGVRLDHCPLCKFGKRVRIYNECACDYCLHYIFNKEGCHSWLKENSSFNNFDEIFTSSHSAVIKRKCIKRHDEWIEKINKKIEEAE